VDNFSSTTQLAAITGGQFGQPSIGVWNRYVVTIPASAMVASIANGLEIRFVRDNTGVSTTRITGVQLEAGPVATPFERLPYGQILQLCLRYFESMVNTTSVSAYINNGYVWSTTQGESIIRFAVQKRSTPIVQIPNALGWVKMGGGQTDEAGTADIISIDSCLIYTTGLSSATVGQSLRLVNNSAGTSKIYVYAEL
jgi:hypothetical protein